MLHIRVPCSLKQGRSLIVVLLHQGADVARRCLERERETERERERASLSSKPLASKQASKQERERERESECCSTYSPPRKPQNDGGPYGPGSLTSSSNPKEEESEDRNDTALV